MKYQYRVASTEYRDKPELSSNRDDWKNSANLPVDTSSRTLAFECSERFLIHVPLFQDREDGSAAKSSTGKLAEDAGGLLLVFGLMEALAAQVIAGLLFLVHVLVGGVHGFLDYLTVNSFGLEVGDDPHAPEFFIVTAEGGVGGSILSIVQVTL